MERRINIAGQKFGLLTAERIVRVGGAGVGAVWSCLCECGNRREVRCMDLRSLNITCCNRLTCKVRNPTAMEYIQRRAVVTDSGCWELPRSRDRDYPVVCTKGGKQTASRAVWEELHGAIPDSLLVCHDCDNRACCNPAHMFLGTHKDNMQDAKAKDRLAVGERSAVAKLTEACVVSILFLRHRGMTRKAIAKLYNVTIGTIDRITSGQSWKAVTEGLVFEI